MVQIYYHWEQRGSFKVTHLVTDAEYRGTARKMLLVAQLPLFCLIVDKSDVVFTDIHFSRHLTPGTDATEGGIKTIIKDSTL